MKQKFSVFYENKEKVSLVFMQLISAVMSLLIGKIIALKLCVSKLLLVAANTLFLNK